MSPAATLDNGKTWSAGAQKYSIVMQDITSRFATQLVQDTDALLPFSSPSTFVLDNGCGSGSVTFALGSHTPGTQILAADIAPEMIKLVSSKNLPGVSTSIADATDLSSMGANGSDATFSHALSAFMIQFPPDATAVVSEMHRVLRPGGVLGLASWSYHDMLNVLHDAGPQLEPSWEKPMPFTNTWPLNEAGVKRELEAIGFVDVKTALVSQALKIDHDALLEYMFEGGNPVGERTLAWWRQNGRIQELREKVTQMVKENWQGKVLSSGAVIAVARKK